MTVRCDQCGREWSGDDVRYCGHCGASLAAEPAATTRIRLARRIPVAVGAVAAALVVGVAATLALRGSAPADIADPNLDLSSTEPAQLPDVTSRGPRCLVGNGTVEITCVAWTATTQRNGPVALLDGMLVALAPDGDIVGRDPSTGQEQWRWDADTGGTAAWRQTLGSHHLLVEDADGVAAVIAAATGQVILRAEPHHDLMTAGVVDGVAALVDREVAGSYPPDEQPEIPQRRLQVLRLDPWEVLGEFAPGPDASGLLPIDGVLVGVEGPEVVAVDFSGQELARRELLNVDERYAVSAAGSLPGPTVAVTAGAVIAQAHTADGVRVVRLDPRTLTPRWTVDGAGDPLLLGDAVVLDDRSPTGTIRVIDVADGGERWSMPRHDTLDDVEGRGDLLLAAYFGEDRRLAAIDLRTSEERWAIRDIGITSFPSLSTGSDGLWGYYETRVLHYDRDGVLPGWGFVGASSNNGAVISSEPFVMLIGASLHGLDRAEIERHLDRD